MDRPGTVTTVLRLLLYMMSVLPTVLCFVPRAEKSSCQSIQTRPFICSNHRFSAVTRYAGERKTPRNGDNGPRNFQNDRRRLQELSKKYKFKMKQARSFEECRLIFQEMKDKGVKRNTYQYSAAIQVSMKSRETARAIMLISNMRKECNPQLKPWSIAIDAAGKAGMWKLAKELLGDLHQASIEIDVICYNSVISACEKGKQWQAALDLLREMASKGIPPDTISYNSVISACEKGAQWQAALDFLREMESKGIPPSLISYSATISACEKGGQWEAAVDLLREMESKGIRPDAISYCAAISACEKGGQWQAALNLLREMDSKGIRPDTISYNSAISACEKGNQWQAAVDLLREMESKGIPPSSISYSAAISACEKGGQWEAALDLLREMASKGIPPNTITYNAAISACEKGGQWQAAVDLLREMESKGIPPSTITYNAVILACGKSGLPRIAHELFLEMVDRRIAFDLASYNSITDALHTNGRSGQALQVIVGAPGVCHGEVSFPQLVGNEIDLHNLSLGSASMVLLLELVKHVDHNDRVINEDLVVITGKGRGSGPSGPVLQGEIPRFLQDSLSLSTTSVPGNSGCFVIQSVSMNEWKQSETGRATIDLIGQLAKTRSTSWSEQDLETVDRLLLVPMQGK